MPLYDYKCTQCGTIAEIRHGFNESHDEPCRACGSPMQRVFNPAPIVFKGSGFYVTDSRKSRSAASESSPSEKPAKSDGPSSSAPAAGSKGSESAA